MAHSPDHSLAPTSAAPSGAPSGAPSAVPTFLRPMSAVPVAELPPLRPLPTNDPYSPVATGQALFCAVFNVTFSTLIAWLASVPQHLIAQVRQAFSSPSPAQSSGNLQSKGEGPVGLRDRNPQSLSERILLACRSLFSLLRVYHTFSSYWDRVTPRQLGLLSRAAQAIKAFSGRSFDFSYWADLGGRPARSYVPASDPVSAPPLPPSPSPQVAPSAPSPRSALATPPFPEWPFTALTTFNASFTMAPGRLLAQVCQDLARLTQSPSPSPSEFESLSPSPSQSADALSSQSPSCSHSQSIPSIESIPPVAPSPCPQVSLSSSVAQSPCPPVSPSSSVAPSPHPPP